MNRIAVVLLLVGVILCSGCMHVKLRRDLHLDEKDWPTEGANDLRQHRAATRIDPPLEEQWRYDAGAGVGQGGVLIVDQVVLVGNRKGQVHAIDLEVGKRIGRIRYDVPIEGSMAVSGNRLFVPLGLEKKSVAAYDLSSGSKLWTAKGAPVEAGLAVVGETVYAADTKATVRAFDTNSGEERWQKLLRERTGVAASPLAVGDLLVVMDEEGRVYGLDLQSGGERWTSELRSPVYNTASSDGQRLFVPTTRGRLFALNASSGETEWLYAVPDTTVRFTSPAFAAESNLLIFGATDGIVRAIDAGNGALVWSTPLNSATITAPLLAAQTVYAATLRGGMLYGLDTRTGAIVWNHEFTGRIKSAMATQDGKIIVLAETQQLIMLTSKSQVEAES